jgi:hypothetical protein
MGTAARAVRNSIETLMLVALAATSFAQERGPRPAVPVEPLMAIFDAFRSHPLVAIGDAHGNEQINAFRLALIRDPRFHAAVNDVVVEFGSAHYQDLIDRFVAGDDVPAAALSHVWQDTTQIEYEWDLPIYEELFRTVRAVNASLRPDQRIRVLLGDPPIDWGQVHAASDLTQYMGPARDAYAAEVIRREVLAKGRRALLIYGDQHLIRRNPIRTAPSEWTDGIVAQLERAGGATVFSIHAETRKDLKALQSSIASWPVPSLAVLRGTTLGAAPFFAPTQRHVLLEDQFDAVLYLGPPSSMTTSQLAPALCADKEYLEMRLSRLSLIPPPPGAPTSPADSLKAYCARSAAAPVTDSDPRLTELVRNTLRDAAQGKVDPERIDPASRERLIPFLNRIGPGVLASAGEIESFVLLTDENHAGNRIRSYRATFASGTHVIFQTGLSPAGLIVSLDPQPEPGP